MESCGDYCLEPEVDRLSDLPDCILHHIFSLIETKYCIRMSVLSKGWNRLWASLPDLLFDGCLGRYSKPTCFHTLVLTALYGRDDHVPINRLELVLHDTYDCGKLGGEFSTKLMTYLDSHNIQHLIFKSPSTKAYPTLFPPTQSSSLSSSLRILELDSCHVDLSNPTPCMPKLTTLYLNGCDFAPNSKTLDQLEFDPFASCVNLKQLYLHKCQFSEGITLKITAPRLVSLDITELTIPHKRDAAFDHIIKLEIWTPKLLSLRLNLYMPLDFSCLHLPVLENLDVQICSATTNNRTTVSFLLNMFRGFHNAQRIKICSKIILILSLLHQLAALHTQPPLFTRLKTLTVQRLKGSSLNKIPDNVLSYFLKGTSLASVEYE